jgi:non-heme chloroperoxidase
MIGKWLNIVACLAALVLPQPAAAAPRSEMVAVEHGIQLEMLDWGGSGPPLVFLAGFGQTAHSFEGFTENFTRSHHVYAITRRGFGASSHPAPTQANYDVERLAADILAVLAKAGIDRPFLAGHSVAGQELAEIGTQHPTRVRGLIYLDAANAEAFYGPGSDWLYPIAGEVRRDLALLIDGQPSEAPKLIAKIEAELPRLQRGLDWYAKATSGEPDRPAERAQSPQMAVQHAIVLGARIHGAVNVPILSIVALPGQCAPECDSEAARRREKADELQAADFAKAHPSATILRLPYADHFVWRSHEQAVVDAMTAFMQKASR